MTPTTTAAATPRKRAPRARSKPAAAPPAGTPAMFDVTKLPGRPVEGVIAFVELEQLTLAANPRKDIAEDGLRRLARMLMTSGQFVPLIGRRDSDGSVLVYAGQRRLLAARMSTELAGGEGFENLKALVGLFVILLDYTPTSADIRRIQAQENQREDLTLVDQVQQFSDCWDDRAGADDDDRIATVCEDLGIGAKRARSLLQCLALPAHLRARLADRPTGDQLSISTARQLAAMHAVSPQLVDAVAQRITTPDHHDSARDDMAAFVHRTVVEDDSTYAVRLDAGALLGAHEEIERARPHITAEHAETLATILAAARDDAQKAAAAAALAAGGAPPDPDDAKAKRPAKLDVDAELERLSRRAKAVALKIPVDAAMRERAASGRFAWVQERGEDFAAVMWIVDPLFFIDVTRELLVDNTAATAVEERYFQASSATSDDMDTAKRDDDRRRAAARERHQQAQDSNLGLGLDITAALRDPHGDQIAALRDIVVLLISEHYGELLAYGAGHTDRVNQRPVGDANRFEPRPIDEIVDAEVTRALADSDPLRGIASIITRLCAAFLLDPDGVTKTKALGSDRMTRKLQAALPGDADRLREAIWGLMRPILSPRLRELNAPAFVVDPSVRSSVDLDAHRGDSVGLDDLDLGDSDTEQER